MAWRGRPTAFADTIERDVGKKTRAAALQALTGVIERSPVDKGTFRGNNRVSIGGPDSGFDLEAADKSGGATLSAGSAKLGAGMAPFTQIYIQNNLPYAQVIENGDWSKQAPQGVYAITLNSLIEASR